MKTKKILLPDQMIPAQWYNIVADMPQKPLPPLDPRTRPSRDGRTDELHLRRRTRTAGVLDRTLHRHPRRGARPLPHLALYAARAGLCAGTGARHAGEDLFQERKRLARRLAPSPNTALPQAYYNAKQGIKHLTTETGGGQWGSAIALASQYFGLDLKVFMVKVSYEQKPYRKLL